MKKKILITNVILMAVFFASCSRLNNNSDGAIVKSIMQWGELNTGKCQYYLHYGGTGFYMIDSSGKYKIGDTLYLIKKHCR